MALDGAFRTRRERMSRPDQFKTITHRSIPVRTIRFADDSMSFLVFRIAIGAIGASFVITQYRTSIMFAPNCVGAANATSAGWGSLGGGVTQLAMPLVFTALVGTFGMSTAVGWRASMFVAGLFCALTGVAYCFLTQDAPEGNFCDLRAQGRMAEKKAVNGAFLAACKDHRVWSLFDPSRQPMAPKRSPT